MIIWWWQNQEITVSSLLSTVSGLQSTVSRLQPTGSSLKSPAYSPQSTVSTPLSSVSPTLSCSPNNLETGNTKIFVTTFNKLHMLCILNSLTHPWGFIWEVYTKCQTFRYHNYSRQRVLICYCTYIIDEYGPWNAAINIWNLQCHAQTVVLKQDHGQTLMRIKVSTKTLCFDKQNLCVVYKAAMKHSTQHSIIVNKLFVTCCQRRLFNLLLQRFDLWL